MALHYAHAYFCTDSGIFVRYHSLAWRRWFWRPTVLEETACYCRWPDITRVEGAKSNLSGGRMSDETYYLTIYANGRVLKATDDDNGLDRFATLRDGLLRYFSGFPLDWRHQLDSHFKHLPPPQCYKPILLYQQTNRANGLSFQ